MGRLFWPPIARKHSPNTFNTSIALRFYKRGGFKNLDECQFCQDAGVLLYLIIIKVALCALWNIRVNQECGHDLCSSAKDNVISENQEARKAGFLAMDFVSNSQRNYYNNIYMAASGLCVASLRGGTMVRPDHNILAKYDHQVPRYTSYPPATRFMPPEYAFSYASWLGNVEGDISLYIHIPFCARLCFYCGCNMRVVNNYELVKDYLDLLKSEISMIARHLTKYSKVSHIHFGGGSPSLIRPWDFQDIMACIGKTFCIKEGAEISIEGDPRHMSETKIAAYAKSGVTRVSLGVQDFNEDVLKSVNRPQPYHMTHRVVSLCREYGLHNINFDLIYGLPGQTVEKVNRTLELAILFQPSRISCFGYAHVPWMKKHMNLLPQNSLPQATQRYDLQEVGARIMQDAGYIQIGIDHFVREDDSMALALKNHKLHRNFQGYTTDECSTLIGIGASSISEFKEGYHQNPSDTRLYQDAIKQGKLATSKILNFHQEDLPVKAIIEDLMCYLQVDIEDICRKYSLPSDSFDDNIACLRSLQEDGVVNISRRLIRITPVYRILARVVCEVFDHYSNADQTFQRHARAI